MRCPRAAVVICDPPYGLHKDYAGYTEQTSFPEWLAALRQWAGGRCGWLIVLGPYATMPEWLRDAAPDQLLMWHRTFVLPNRKSVRGWTRSLTPILVYDFGGTWYGPSVNDRLWHDVIDAHSSMGDVQRLKKLGIRPEGHPAITGTALPSKLLRGYAVPGDLVVDPMCGIGSILVAAQRIGCRVWGCEIEKAWTEYATRWLDAEEQR